MSEGWIGTIFENRAASNGANVSTFDQRMEVRFDAAAAALAADCFDPRIAPSCLRLVISSFRIIWPLRLDCRLSPLTGSAMVRQHAWALSISFVSRTFFSYWGLVRRCNAYRRLPAPSSAECRRRGGFARSACSKWSAAYIWRTALPWWVICGDKRALAAGLRAGYPNPAPAVDCAADHSALTAQIERIVARADRLARFSLAPCKVLLHSVPILTYHARGTYGCPIREE